MKQTRKTLTCHLAIALMAAAAALSAQGAAPPTLQGRIVPRALTPGDKTTYGLPSTTEVSGGISTVAVGTPVYLEAEINLLIPATNITGVTWSLTNLPTGSAAALTTSPLPANMPVYEPSDRMLYQVADRRLLRPDVTGQYTVLATITTANYGTTNVALTLTEEPNAIVVPTQAIQTGQEGSYVFVVKPDLTAESRPVKVERNIDNQAVIESGLSAGEKVVTDGQIRLVTGAKVEIKNVGMQAQETKP